MDGTIQEIAEILKRALDEDASTVRCRRVDRRTVIRFERGEETIEEWEVLDPGVAARIGPWMNRLARYGGRKNMPPGTISVRRGNRIRYFRLDSDSPGDVNEVVLRLLP